MKRSRSALARHRQRKLLEATLHVSTSSELRIVAALAGAASLCRPRDKRDDDHDDEIDDLPHHDPETANHVISALRNVKNSVYHRAMAARALGLLMLHAPTLLTRLARECEELLDALLQLVNCCRRFETHNADTRRVHVNCCLVISMLMRATTTTTTTTTTTAAQQNASSHERLQLVVSLDSALLAMPSRPTEKTSGFLLLTVSGRPETSADDAHDEPFIVREPLQPIRRNRRPLPPPLPAASPLKFMSQPHSTLSPLKSNHLTEVYGNPTLTKPNRKRHVDPHPLPQSHRPIQHHNDDDDGVDRSEETPLLAARIQQLRTPSRQFKMDRFRVVTPALVPSSATGTGTSTQRSWSSNPLPVIPPSRGQMQHARPSTYTIQDDDSPAPVPVPHSQSNNQLDSSPRETSSSSDQPRSFPSPTAASTPLLNAHHMVEIFRTGRMPVASAGYFHQHLHDDDGLNDENTNKAATTPNRLAVVEWSEWQRRQQQQLNGNHDPGAAPAAAEEAPVVAPVVARSRQPPKPLQPQPSSQSSSTPLTASAHDIHTPAYKRQRLRDILSSPVEPLAHNTASLLALDRRMNTTTMHALDTELAQLRASEVQSRHHTQSLIEKERDRLPLKFLFQLPGGAAYCRDRMRRAVMLWVAEFEANQQRMALLQWKAVVEQWRFQQRGHAYHRLAIEKRLRVAIEFVLRGYQHQALTKWIEAVQLAIWRDRDDAVRLIQRQVRRGRALRRFLRLHDAHPVGGPVLRDIYLARERHADGVAFRIPSRVREERRRIWFAAQLVQGVYRKRRFRQSLRRYRIAATKIQAQARMRIARAQYRDVRRRIVLFQAFVRMQRDYRVYQTLRCAAIRVQVQFRSVRLTRMRRLVVQTQRRQVEWRLSHALLLQRITRGFLARRDAQRRRQQRDDEFQAALVVQRAWYRRNGEWSTFLLLGCLREKENEEVAFEKHVLAWTRRTMATRLQRTWRLHRLYLRSCAAVVVQRNVRRWSATRFVQRKRLQKMAHRRIKWFFRFRHANRIIHATKIQFAWLRAVHGRLTAHLHMRRLEMEASRARDTYVCRDKAATRLQAAAGGMRGRTIARQERSARVIQRATRAFLRWRRVQREIRRIKLEVARDAATQWIAQASQRVFTTRMATLNRAATEIQRFVRGFVWRTQLTKLLVAQELRARMARRIQSLWRQNAQRRLATRVLRAQRRRRDNPFQSQRSIAHVLKEMTKRASALYDPRDELQGLHVAAWLQQLGFSGNTGDQYVALLVHKHAIVCVDQLRAALAAKEKDEGDGDDDSIEACRRMLKERLGVTSDDDAQRMATNLVAAKTLQEVKSLRAQHETLRKVQREDDKRIAFVQQQLQHARQSKTGIADELEEVLTEATEFRHPPKALRDKREKLTTAMDEATKTVAAIQKKVAAMQRSVAQRKMEMLRLQERITSREKDEISAVYSLQNFKLLGDHLPRVANELFLSKFPGLEARALAFVGALADAQVTTWQLLRFFQVNTTIAQVKSAMATLTYFKHTSDVKKHDQARFLQCCDVLQFGFERLGELVELSVDEMVVVRPGSDKESGESLPDMVLTAMARAQRVRLVRDRAVAWTQSAQTLLVMNSVATRVQCQWRRRAATRVIQTLRSHRLKKQLRDAYLAEVQADYVTPIWQQDREKELQEYEQWERDQARAAREQVLQETLRFPWMEDWDDTTQSYVVYRQVGSLQKNNKMSGDDEGEGEELEEETAYEYYAADAERPVYTVEEEDATIVIQALVRRFLARCALHERRRQQQRAINKLALEQKWLTKANERAQTMTLRLEMDFNADARVALWIGHRQKQQQKEKQHKQQQQQQQQHQKTATAASTSPTRQRRKATQSEDEEKKTLQQAMTLEAFETQLRGTSVIAQCESAYHRSVRNEHRRHVLFPANARPLNIHTQALLEFVDATQKLQRALALQTHTRTALAFTKVALPFGWQEIRGENGNGEKPRPYFYHSLTHETSWDRPQYAFEHEYAAIKIQSLARVAIAQAARARELDGISFVATIHDTIQQTARVGWIGFGLEGISTAVFLSRLGLAKYNSVAKLTSLSVDELLRLSETKLKKIGWNNEEITTLKSTATALRGDLALTSTSSTSHTFPLSTACRILLPPTTKHAFNFLPSERVLQQLVAQSLPNQQGRVLGLVRAVRQSSTPISYRQLEMHLRLYAGRPDDAVSHIRDIASLAYATQPPQEKAILDKYLRCLERCVVFAANLKLHKLHTEVCTTLRVAKVLLVPTPLLPSQHQHQNQTQKLSGVSPRDAEDEGETVDVISETVVGQPVETLDVVSLLDARVLASVATPITPVSLTDPAQVELQASAARRRCSESPTKGMWEEHIDHQSPLSAAQVALFLRERGLERVLLWYRSVTMCQATYRMHKMRDWYRSVVAFRRYSATIIQCAWRVYCAMETTRLLESQQRSPYEQRYDKLTKTFFFVYVPTSEKLLDEPRDAQGAMMAYRPMVQDRVTKRWLQAWPHLGQVNAKDKATQQRRGSYDWENDDNATPCSVCHVERAARRCSECYSSTGDYVDFCLACFFDTHATTLDWHTFTPLHRLKTRAFHCVECKRLSTMRCLMCHEHYCERCFTRVHRKGHTRVRHTCEFYDAMAVVCVECESRVAFQKCLVCQDAMCEDCMARTHARGTKQSHELKLIRQTLLNGEGDSGTNGHVYCQQCHARRGDTTCTFCATALCQLCLADASKHAVECPETQLQLTKQKLLGDRLCVECSKPADRKCESCGDKYCSVTWMGNPGCFERFHWKGRRADHHCVPLTDAPTEMPREILEIEEKIKLKRRRDAEKAEVEARAMAAALEADARAAAAAAEIKKKQRNKMTRKGASKRRLLGSAASRAVCCVDECALPTLSAALPFCARHLTSQHALEVSKQDPLEAAKLLALVDKHGGTLPVMAESSSSLWQRMGLTRTTTSTAAAAAPPSSTTQSAKAKETKKPTKKKKDAKTTKQNDHKA